MATPPDSPGPEEALFDFESTRTRQQTTRPVALEELLRQTKFSRQEIRVMYRGFKQVSNTQSENTAGDTEFLEQLEEKWVILECLRHLNIPAEPRAEVTPEKSWINERRWNWDLISFPNDPLQRIVLLIEILRYGNRQNDWPGDHQLCILPEAWLTLVIQSRSFCKLTFNPGQQLYDITRSIARPNVRAHDRQSIFFAIISFPLIFMNGDKHCRQTLLRTPLPSSSFSTRCSSASVTCDKICVQYSHPVNSTSISRSWIFILHSD